MFASELPQSCAVNKSIPKNALLPRASAAQKRDLTNLVQRITWTHRLTPETINLPGLEIEEIQLFHIHLKSKDRIKGVRELLEKSIPYSLLLTIEFQEEAFVSSCQKHPHPSKSGSQVLDWTFESEWAPIIETKLQIQLTKSLDHVLKEAWFAIRSEVSKAGAEKGLDIESLQAAETLKKDIAVLESRMKKEKQFNRKVEMNQELMRLKAELDAKLR